jgi:hypothetical protein
MRSYRRQRNTVSPEGCQRMRSLTCPRRRRRSTRCWRERTGVPLSVTMLTGAWLASGNRVEVALNGDAPMCASGTTRESTDLRLNHAPRDASGNVPGVVNPRGQASEPWPAWPLVSPERPATATTDMSTCDSHREGGRRQPPASLAGTTGAVSDRVSPSRSR